MRRAHHLVVEEGDGQEPAGAGAAFVARKNLVGRRSRLCERNPGTSAPRQRASWRPLPSAKDRAPDGARWSSSLLHDPANMAPTAAPDEHQGASASATPIGP